MISYCGLTCTKCPAFTATQKDDHQKRIDVARSWSEEFKAEIKPEDINCDGCMSEGGRLFNHCKVCTIRKCGQAKHIENCAHCNEYPCRELSFIINAVPDAKATLEEIRKNIAFSK